MNLETLLLPLGSNFNNDISLRDFQTCTQNQSFQIDFSMPCGQFSHGQLSKHYYEIKNLIKSCFCFIF